MACFLFVFIYVFYFCMKWRAKAKVIKGQCWPAGPGFYTWGLNKWPCVDYLIDELIMCVLTAYLNSFEENKSQEQQRIRDAQSSIVALLEHSSKVQHIWPHISPDWIRSFTRLNLAETQMLCSLQNINHLQQLSAVTAQELRSMQEDLSFKETEMQKSQSTAKGLSSG